MAFWLKWPFDLIKAGATHTETSLLKQYVAGERVDVFDDSFGSLETFNACYSCQRVGLYAFLSLIISLINNFWITAIMAASEPIL